MSPLFIETGSETNSPSSMSAEENPNSNAGSEREGEEQVGKRGTKRQVKNRDAARKSRRKQTERADELHEELQSLERSNSAFHKEIASLKKDLILYTTALERHMPLCTLKASASSSTTDLSANCQTRSSPPQRSSPTQAAAPQPSTSLTSSPSLQTLDCVKSSPLRFPMPATTAAALNPTTVSSAQPFTSSSTMTAPYALPLTTGPSPHSLFCADPSSLTAPSVTKTITNKPNAAPCTSLSTRLQSESGQSSDHKSSLFSAHAGLSSCQPYAAGALQLKQASFRPPYSPSVSGNKFITGQVSVNSPPHPGSSKGNPVNLSPLSLSSLREPAPQSLSVPPQANPEPSFAAKPSYTRHLSAFSSPLLPLLSSPCPFNASQTTSSNSVGPLSDTPPQHSGESSVDRSLSDLLELNDWILQHDQQHYF